ncbi:MAG: AlpA family phage regulatory protein [Gammaproteobacteria bacterium]|jgi:predicted DNA-binding transcriptional regulator AlpA|nr:AlpA family phage regulatory protein [Gammaproteobacteria bacterium]MBT5269862.1 AlpA family phage regulatory protein [Candidatus Neomarinimicrobiota bacterium]MBT6012370.1 AlpA family phage regulatory protein [Candidatus Neomarinimicrobiota bacterium]
MSGQNKVTGRLVAKCSSQFEKILRMKDLIFILRVSPSSIRRWESQGKFPKSFSIGGSRSVGWLASEVDAFIQQRAAEREES